MNDSVVVLRLSHLTQQPKVGKAKCGTATRSHVLRFSLQAKKKKTIEMDVVVVVR